MSQGVTFDSKSPLAKPGTPAVTPSVRVQRELVAKSSKLCGYTVEQLQVHRFVRAS